MKFLRLLVVAGASTFAATPDASLPDGFELVPAATAPLVQHPIMAGLGEPGVLYVADAAGENMNKADLEKHLPNRVVRLVDANGDGTYDKATVFADKMTFPQGALWLDGSLFVMSPPGLWKLTDGDGDGVAEKREMLVGGFEYTGNAADVHGPFLHPNGRLYWCHGRKGHKVAQRDGTLVHEGLASGIWSCERDGSDVRWHALGCGDNPVEIDFTPEGEILGTQNIQFTNPRADTIVHWLRGGVYPRPDQLKAIVGLPRTLDTMPVVHNYGHVAVSGFTFYRSGAFDGNWRGNMFVTHFNTQRLTRMEVSRDGASYKVTEREFLKLHNPDVHLTDVLEDRDGSLLVLDTGGWFRIGCPSSLMAKPEIAGAIYRVRKTGAPVQCDPWGADVADVWKRDVKALITAIGSSDERIARAAANALATKQAAGAIPALVKALDNADPGVQLAAAHALGAQTSLDQKTTSALLRRIGGEVDRAVEHQAMFALLNAGQPGLIAEALGDKDKPVLQRRALTLLDQLPDAPLSAARVLPLLDASDTALATKAAEVAARRGDWDTAAHFAAWLEKRPISAERLALIERVAPTQLGAMTEVVTTLLDRAPQTAWRILAAGDSAKGPAAWSTSLRRSLGSASPADLPLVLAAATKVGTPELRGAMREFSDDAKQPLAFRLKALGASTDRSKPLPAESFDLLKRALGDASSSARLEASRILASAKLAKEQVLALAPIIPTLGPLELREFLKAFRGWLKTENALALAQALKNSVVLATIQESEIRTVFSDAKPEIFAEIAPALAALAADDAARRRLLETLPARIAKEGRAVEGRKLFESNIGACATCHRVGDVGNLVGPNLSTIGNIRIERDLLESILFPDNSLARDYEAHAIETADGRSFVGVVRGSLPDVLVFADAGAQEHRIPHTQITANTTLPTSLMPAGLDKAMTEQQLLDLVAYLRSRK
ncbi:MAG: PVC-type heme-binding CxxCH protein [Chthoniobacteraceae bacterium]